MRSLIGFVHQHLVHERRVDRLAFALAAVLPANATVADVGSGDGLLAARIMTLRPDLAITGYDVLARPHAHIPVALFDGEHIPLDSASVDFALLVDVLHHTDDPAVLLAECARVARRGVVVKDHLRDGLGAGVTLRFMDWIGNAPHGVRLPYHYLSAREWRTLFQRSALTAEYWDERVRLYPLPASWLFGRRLHFVARLRKAGG